MLERFLLVCRWQTRRNDKEWIWQTCRQEMCFMNYLEAFILGLVQGLGEFLPISSSAHLVIMPWLVDFSDPGLSFTVALHLGTLFAVLFYFWQDWIKIFFGSFSYLRTRDRSQRQPFLLLFYLIVATVPAAIGGIFLDDWAETVFRSPLLVAVNMALLGGVLLFVDKKNAGTLAMEGINLRSAILIGLSQTLALVPGVSRSGITITAGLILGLTRTEAARFSFLLSTPIIIGACVFKYQYFLQVFDDPQALFGIAVAGITGFLSIKYLLKLVAHFTYSIFCYYRFFFALLVLLVYVLR